MLRTDNETDSDSCGSQTAHSHEVREKTGSACHTDLQTISLTRTHIHTHPGCWSLMSAVSTQHAISSNSFQKAEQTKDTKNVNTVEGIRADHTAGGEREGERESLCSLISPGDLTLDSISADHLLQRSARARPGSVLSRPDTSPSSEGFC